MRRGFKQDEVKEIGGRTVLFYLVQWINGIGVYGGIFCVRFWLFSCSHVCRTTYLFSVFTFTGWTEVKEAAGVGVGCVLRLEGGWSIPFL